MFLITFFASIQISDINSGRLEEVNIEGKSKLKIFNLNTEYWEKGEKLDDFYEYLQQQNADIYLLQEYFDYDGNGNYSEYPTEYLAQLAEYFPNHDLIREDEFVTLVNRDFEVIENFTEESPYYLQTDLNINNKVYSIYNAHIPVHVHFATNDNFFDLIADVRRRFYLRDRVLNSLEKDILNNQNFIILGGDFNTTRSMGRMDNLFGMLKDSRIVSTEPFANTWNSFWRIDYILTSESIQLLNHNVIDTYKFSDHNGILVEILID